MSRRLGTARTSHGTPIEEAPLWVLAIFAALLWLVAFPALAGLVYPAIAKSKES